MSAGHEKVRYVGGGVTVITKNHVESDSLVKCADEILNIHLRKDGDGLMTSL